MTILLQLHDLVEGVVVKRPSKYIKTPYVADVHLCLEDRECLGHSASLGCCGLADVGAHVLMGKATPSKASDGKLRCEYKLFLSILREKEQEILVGIHPTLAEQLVESALKQDCLSSLRKVRCYRTQAPMYLEGVINSRFDFAGIDANGTPFILEVKNVPLADYEDVTAKERKRMMSFDDRPVHTKIAYFPDGYRKQTKDPVSPRALKHLHELTLIKRQSVTRCIMCYVVQRTDVNRFRPSVIDPQYQQAFREAQDVGVEMIVMVVEWSREGVARFVRDDLPIHL